MLKSILVPLDGSGFAEQALPWAACLARSTGSLLELVRVHDPVPPWTIASEGAVAATAFDPSIRDAEEQYLANCVVRLRKADFHRSATPCSTARWRRPSRATPRTTPSA